MAVKSAKTLALQKQLLSAGFNPGPLDGIMGPRTQAALNQYSAKQAAQPSAPAATVPQPVQSAPTPAPTPTGPAANPLYSDPAFLAYAANSGRDYETAAADTARRQAALQNALALKTPEIKQQGEDQLKSIYGNYASRGLYGAGQQAEDEGKSQANTLGQIAQAQATTQSGIEDLTSGLAQKRQDLLAGSASRGYDVAGNQDLEQRLSAVDKKYPLGTKTGAY